MLAFSPCHYVKYQHFALSPAPTIDTDQPSHALFVCMVSGLIDRLLSHASAINETDAIDACTRRSENVLISLDVIFDVVGAPLPSRFCATTLVYTMGTFTPHMLRRALQMPVVKSILTGSIYTTRGINSMHVTNSRKYQFLCISLQI